MPASKRTRGRVPSSDAVIPTSDTVEPVESGLAKLNFNQPLSWTPGKAIAVADLLQRLQTVYKELVPLEPEDIDLESIKPVARELVSQRLIAHKDRGVRAWTGCVLVEVLRIFVPNAPYTARELKDIFTLFITTTIPALGEPSNPYNAQHLLTVQSLADIKSILLITDIPSSGQLLQTLFAQCFNLLSGPSKSGPDDGLPVQVEHLLTALLVVLVHEAPNLSDDVIDVILAQFLRADPRSMTASSGTKGKKQATADDSQATLLLKDAPAAYVVAQSICNTAYDQMARYVLRYFSAALVDNTLAFSKTSSNKRQSRKGTVDEDEKEEPQGPSEEDLQESRKAHRLLRELWRAAPNVLQEIIPQLENELTTENDPIRLLAVETIGDMIVGIGAAGPPPPPNLDPAAYPSQSLVEPSSKSPYFFLAPAASAKFSSKYPSTYQAFVGRRLDKSPAIRAAWVTAVARILCSYDDGFGLDPNEEDDLIRYFADFLIDGDDKVRHAAVNAVEHLRFSDVIKKLGRNGGVEDEKSILSYLTDRMVDKRPAIHTDAINYLAKLWGVAAGTIAEGDEQIKRNIGPIVSKIFLTSYRGDKHVMKLVERALFESLLPLTYPPIKSKPSANGSQANGKGKGEEELDVDKIRAERLLVLVQQLDTKSRASFMSKPNMQAQYANYLLTFLQRCEKFNGGVVDDPEQDEKTIKDTLGQLITTLSQTLPEPMKAREDLWKFAKAHDRRSYALIRFCCDPASDWSKIRRSIKELTKRIEESTSSASSSSILDTILTIVYRAAVLIYNRSHIPAIIQYSRTNENGLAATAHDLLKEISKHKSEVFKAHVEDLCKSLEADAPTASKAPRPDAVEDLKALSDFARKFPGDVPQDRKFLSTLLSHVKYGQPGAAKSAVIILLTATSKKEMYAKEIFSYCTKDFKYGQKGYLTKLAALSQLVLHGTPFLSDQQADDIQDIAISQVLTNLEAGNEDEEEVTAAEWTAAPSDHASAKLYAIKILVNWLRAHPEAEDVSRPSEPAFQYLTKVISSKGQPAEYAIPPSHASRLRLIAAQSYLKLCREKRFYDLVSPQLFEQIAATAQDTNFNVREGFVRKSMKYLSLNQLANRFYTPLFLLAYEPVTSLKRSVETWLRGRAVAFATEKKAELEGLLARLISLLAHHPDFNPESEALVGFINYFIFYLQTVATRDNASLIFHVAQKVKTVSDGMAKGLTNIYILSDLAQAVIRKWADKQDWGIEAWPGKSRLPAAIFLPMESKEKMLAIPQKIFIPDEVSEAVESSVVAGLRSGKAKRKAIGDGDSKTRKRTKTGLETKKAATAHKPVKARKATPKKAKAPKATAIPSSERRRSGRTSGAAVNYHEDSDDEGHDVEMEDVNAKGSSPSVRTNGKWAAKDGRKSAIQLSSDKESSEDEDDE